MVAQVHEIDNLIVWLDRQDEADFFERQARALLGITGDEFRERLAAGDYADRIDDPDSGEVMYLALLASVVR